jgi:hypothetical protein
MSGIEILGIILGGIPLIISALEHYHDGVSAVQRWRKWDRERRSVLRALKIESVKLQNTLEKLLSDIVPLALMETMVQNPYGPLWSRDDIKIKVRSKLAASSDAFEESVQEIKEAMQGMGRKLGLGSDITVRGVSPKYIQN